MGESSNLDFANMFKEKVKWWYKLHWFWQPLGFVFRSVSKFPCAVHGNYSFLVLKSVMQKEFNDILRETDLHLL